MKQQPSRNALEARFLRKHNKDGGYDEEEEEEDNRFKQNFEQALKGHSKKATIQNVEEQIEYFGFKMEPFNMKEEQQMGQIDQENFFVFGNKRRFNDAWVDNLNDQNEEAVDKMRKKVKQEQREKNVYQAEKKLNDDYESDEDDEDKEGQKQEQEKEIEDEGKLNSRQIKQLLTEMLPFGLSANQYSKKLKKEKQTELYEKVIFLCNEYIAATGEHNILTIKKEDLEEELEEGNVEEQQPIGGWDKDQSEEIVEKKEQKQQKQDEDDIF